MRLINDLQKATVRKSELSMSSSSVFRKIAGGHFSDALNSTFKARNSKCKASKFFLFSNAYLFDLDFIPFHQKFQFFQISLRLSKIIWFWFHSISFKTFQLFSDFILNDTRTRQIFQTHCSAHWIEIQYLIQRYNILKLEILL